MLAPFVFEIKSLDNGGLVVLAAIGPTLSVLTSSSATTGFTQLVERHSLASPAIGGRFSYSPSSSAGTVEFALIHEDKQLTHWQVDTTTAAITHRRVRTFPKGLSALDFGPDGRTIAVSDRWGDVYIVDLDAQKNETDAAAVAADEKPAMGHCSVITQIQFSRPSFRFLFTSDHEGKVRISYYPNLNEIASVVCGHKGSIEAFAQIPNRPAALFTAGKDSVVRAVSVQQGKPEELFSVSMEDDARWGSLVPDAATLFWHHDEIKPADRACVRDVGVSHAHPHTAALLWDGSVRVFEYGSGSETTPITVEPVPRDSLAIRSLQSVAIPVSVEFAPSTGDLIVVFVSSAVPEAFNIIPDPSNTTATTTTTTTDNGGSVQLSVLRWTFDAGKRVYVAHPAPDAVITDGGEADVRFILPRWRVLLEKNRYRYVRPRTYGSNCAGGGGGDDDEGSDGNAGESDGGAETADPSTKKPRL